MSGSAQFTTYDRARIPSSLWKAWRHVRSKGLGSVSRQTRLEISEFDRHAETKIASISRRLKRQTFQFQPAAGVAKKRSGKAPRPIVIATVEARIVQRSILNALREVPALDSFFHIPTSFGMVGVPPAIEKAYRMMQSGEGVYYIRSDIQGFFAQMPRSVPLTTIADVVPDEKLNGLLAAAMEVDLANAANLGESLSLFPDDETGVAQGCALSAFLGDVLLRDFDEKMNGRAITCLRYVDDFLLLGPSPSTVSKAFTNAQDLLGKMNLRAYEPNVSPDKAAEGWTNKKWEFLGCEIIPGIIRPSGKSKKRLLTKIEAMIRENSASLHDPTSVRARRASLVETLSDIDRLVRGWGNQYQYCNDAEGFATLELEVGQRVDQLMNDCRAAAVRQDGPEASRNRQRIVGVHVLSDSKSDPITTRLQQEK